MGNQAGFTLMELVVVVGVAGLLTAVALPGMRIAMDRNKVITTSELVGATLREARLAAITRNSRFRVRFDCPAAGSIRMLAVTGNNAIDAAGNRCELNQANDGPAVYMPTGVSFGLAPTVEVDGRGQVSLVGGGGLPTNIGVSYGSYTRNITITATGRVRTPTN